jgi:hypothetical protein
MYIAENKTTEVEVCESDENCCDSDSSQEEESCCTEKDCCEKVPGTTFHVNIISVYLNKTFSVQFFNQELTSNNFLYNKPVSSGYLNSVFRPPLV